MSLTPEDIWNKNQVHIMLLDNIKTLLVLHQLVPHFILGNEIYVDVV